MASDPELDLRGRLVRSLGALREMLPGSFVERARRCGKPNCHCADGEKLHAELLLSVLLDGKSKTFHVPFDQADEVRSKVEQRKQFEAAAARIAYLNLRRFLRRGRRREGCGAWAE